MKNKLTSSKTLKILLLIFAIIVVCVVTVLFVAKPYNKSDISYSKVTIENGADTEDVAEALVDSGMIRSEGAFKFVSTIMLYNDKYKPGTYSLSPSMDMFEIAKTIIKGITTDNGFVLPVGYTLEQTADALAQAGFVDKDRFLEICNSLDYSQFDFLSGASSLEGYLMPGTYTMDKSASEDMIIVTLLNQFDQSYTDEMKAKADAMGLSTYDVVCLASYLENQTNVDKERRLISSVIHNRLAQGMELDGGYPYTPLCSPSIESIQAILNPESTDYLYFVFSDSLNGTHKFTASAEEYQELLDKLNTAYAKNNSSKESSEDSTES